MDPPNVDYRCRADPPEVEYTTCRGVEEGEELCIFYGRVWFDDANKGGGGDGSSSSDDEDFLGRIQVGEADS